MLGKLSQRLPAFPENTPGVLNQFIIYISFPATVLLKINSIEMRLELMVLAVIPWILVGLAIISIVLISKVLQWEKKMAGAVILSVALGNTAFFGYPAVSAFFGEDSLGYAIIYDQLGSFIALATVGTIVVSIYGTSERISFRLIIHKIIGFPPFIALIAGVFLMRVTVPPFLTHMLEGMAATLVPLAIFSVGSQLKFRQPMRNVNPIFIILLLKMVVSPIAAFLILISTGTGGPVLQISVFQAAMPTMVMSGVLCAAGKLKSDVANAAIGYGLLLSFITLPIVYYIVIRF